MTTLARRPNHALNLKQGVASNRADRYRLPVAVNPANGFCSPINNRRTSVHVLKTDAFFVPGFSSYGSCAWGALERAGFLLSRSANLRTAATQSCFAADSGGSSTIGATPMTSIIPPALRALAHRRMALSALRANASLRTRLTRYRHHVDRARTLEAQGGAQ